MSTITITITTPKPANIVIKERAPEKTAREKLAELFRILLEQEAENNEAQ